MEKAESAREIAEKILQQTGIALMARDCEAFARHISFPHLIETFQGQQRVDTPDHLRTIFHSVRAHLDKIGATDTIRRIIEADFKTSDRIESTSEARLLNGAKQVMDAYVVYSVINRDPKDGNWKIASSVYAVRDAPEFNAALAKSG